MILKTFIVCLAQKLFSGTPVPRNVVPNISLKNVMEHRKCCPGSSQMSTLCSKSSNTEPKWDQHKPHHTSYKLWSTWHQNKPESTKMTSRRRQVSKFAHFRNSKCSGSQVFRFPGSQVSMLPGSKGSRCSCFRVPDGLIHRTLWRIQPNKHPEKCSFGVWCFILVRTGSYYNWRSHENIF